MIIEEIISGLETLEERRAWKKQGNKVKMKYRCGSGPRKGRMVSDPKQCHAGKNVAKSRSMKKTRAAKGHKMTKKASRAKKYSPASRRVRTLNRK